MSERSIVEFEREVVDGKDIIKVKLDSCPRCGPEDKVLASIDLEPIARMPLDTPEQISAYGESVARELATQEGIREELKFLATRRDRTACTLYFKIGPEQAETIRWETLCGANHLFYALRSQSPIARIADLESTAAFGPVAFEPPLRLQAFISALDIGGKEEWEMLYQAVLAGRAQGLPIACEVYVGEPELYDAIEAVADDRLTVGFIPSNRVDLKRAIDAYAPHVLHFFCHGSSGAGDPYLELGTRGNWEELALFRATGQAQEITPLVVPIDWMPYEVDALREAWLVTLNCCEGAAAGNGAAQAVHAGLYSMAYRLVSKTGVPGVVAMQEPIEPLDAHYFCRYFYEAAFALLLEAVLDARGSVAFVDWAPALVTPRQALQAQRPDGRQWTLPVLYTRQERFMIASSGWKNEPDDVLDRRYGAPASPPDDALERIQELARLLKGLPPTTPESFRRELIDTFLADVPAHRRPTLYGAL